MLIPRPWGAFIAFRLVQYNNGIPEDSRYAVHKDDWGTWTQHLLSEEGQKEIAKVKELTGIAEKGGGNTRKRRACDK